MMHCFSSILVMAIGFVLASAQTDESRSWYKSEIKLLADLKARLTGSQNQNVLIDHIQSELRLLNLPVYTDVLNFTYNKPLGDPHLVVDGAPVEVSSSLPYSGNTDASGVSGKLVNLIGPDAPEWSKASGAIAVINATVSESIIKDLLPVWPGNTPFPNEPGSPEISGNFSLAPAAAAGVKGIICVWGNITTANVKGQYVFGRLYSGVPALFVGPSAGPQIVKAADASKSATLSIPGVQVPDTETRTIWTVFEGSKYKNESVIINTHTDGVNALEENGHIALLARARNLTQSPPQRTTIILFVTGHLIPFSPLRATGRWLSDNPGYWRGGRGQMKSVVASCAEHLGALTFNQNIAANTYKLTNKTYPEFLYADTISLASLTKTVWSGAQRSTRVADPNPLGTQFGEGFAFFKYGIPEVSLVTSPPYLTAIFPTDFDETALIDLNALRRQVDSFGRLWDAFDTMPVAAFGRVPGNRTAEVGI